MVVKKLISTPRKLQDILDSDDELPDRYDEIADVPAYQDDARFNHILQKNKIVEPPNNVNTNNQPIGFVNITQKNYSLENKKKVNLQENKPNKNYANQSIRLENVPMTSDDLVKNRKVIKLQENIPNENFDNRTVYIVEPPHKSDSLVTKKKNYNLEENIINEKNVNPQARHESLVKNKEIINLQENIPNKHSDNQPIGFVNTSHKNDSLIKNKKLVNLEEILNEDSDNDLLSSSDTENISSELSFYSDIYIDEPQKINNKILVNEGVISYENIVCIKSVEAIHNNSTLIWFINYLLYKDMQSKYTHASSCLVHHLDNENNSIISNMHNECNLNMKIIVKC